MSFTIKICVTLNKGQGQYNEHVMHLMLEAVTVPGLMMMTSTVSDESLAMYTQTL